MTIAHSSVQAVVFVFDLRGTITSTACACPSASSGVLPAGACRRSAFLAAIAAGGWRRRGFEPPEASGPEGRVGSLGDVLSERYHVRPRLARSQWIEATDVGVAAEACEASVRAIVAQLVPAAEMN
jgi:hypothetical protein